MTRRSEMETNEMRLEVQDLTKQEEVVLKSGKFE